MTRLHQRDGGWSFYSDADITAIQENDGLRECNKCFKMLPSSDFSPNSGRNSNRTACRKCTTALNDERNALRPYHPYPDEDYCCPICQRSAKDIPDSYGGFTRVKKFVLDHNHITGEFRGWLCHKCNINLGGFNDDPANLTRAICYLLDMPVEKADFILFTINRLKGEDPMDDEIAGMVLHEDEDD